MCVANSSFSLSFQFPAASKGVVEPIPRRAMRTASGGGGGGGDAAAAAAKLYAVKSDDDNNSTLVATTTTTAHPHSNDNIVSPFFNSNNASNSNVALDNALHGASAAVHGASSSLSTMTIPINNNLVDASKSMMLPSTVSNDVPSLMDATASVAPATSTTSLSQHLNAPHGGTSPAFLSPSFCSLCVSHHNHHSAASAMLDSSQSSFSSRRPTSEKKRLQTESVSWRAFYSLASLLHSLLSLFFCFPSSVSWFQRCGCQDIKFTSVADG